MTRHGDARFPPRGELPPDILIPRLAGLGTSWYERRLSYWSRRAGAVLLLVIAVAIYSTIIAGVVSAAGPPGSTGFLAALLAEIVFSIATGVFAFRHLWRLGISGRSTRGNPRTGAAGASAGILAFGAGAVGVAILVVSALLTAGFVLAALAIWLVPVPPAEQHARRFVADQLRQYRTDHSHPYRKHGRRTR
jgi:hypothetical protein